MKSINVYKLAIIATSMVMVYFTSGLASIAQASELLKAEPVKQEHLISQAEQQLALTFSTMSIAPISTEDSASNMLAEERITTNNNQTIMISKTTLISE
jgi:hypothetical protein